MAAYADDAQVAAARARYFENSGFAPDGGYDDDWVRFKVGPLPIAFPNTPGRKAAVPAHDLHHVATDYGTDLAGEAEIGAWEIASGCWQSKAAWVLNTLVQFPIILFALPRVYRAYVRGRHSRNLYDDVIDETLLGGTVGALRHRLALDVPAPSPSWLDRLDFLRFVATVLAIQAMIVVVFFGVPAWLLGAFD